MPTAKGATVTFTPIYENKFLFVQRDKDDNVLGGYWAFPGGKIEVGETIADAMSRECQEETGLSLAGRTFFVDSYLLGERFGLHFAVEVRDDHVTLGDDLQDYAWISSVDDLKKFTPRIPGIDNHLLYTISHLNRFHQAVDVRDRDALQSLAWTDLSQLDLVAHRFLNK